MKLFFSYKLLCLFLFINLINIKLFAQIHTIDSGRKNILPTTKNDNPNVKSLFFIVDAFMDNGQFDSAQIWLNKTYEKIPAKAISKSNYYLISRQAEVYYYNNLQQLGLQHSLRGLDVAKALGDSTLLADSYNFVGLFYMNMDSLRKAVPYFEQGIKYVKQPAELGTSFNLTEPHHLYGNLSEVYYKLKKYDSALISAHISLRKATEINRQRGIAVAYISVADAHMALHNTDSSFYYYQNALFVTNKEKQNDLALISHCGLAKYFIEKNHVINANAQIQAGMSLLNDNPNINPFFSLQFLNSAILIYGKSKNKEGLNTIFQLKSDIQSNNLKSSNTQIQTILNAGVANEKRLLSLELSDAQQKQKLSSNRLVIAVIVFCLFGIAFLVYRYYLNQKLALAAMRNKISQDLHDDIGASLSSLQLYSAVATQHMANNPDKTKDLLNKISMQATHLMDNISDMVWSMKQGKEQVVYIDAKIKNFVADVFAAKNISYSVEIETGIEELIKNSNAKRNILMIVKEAINNVVKYSNASDVSIILKKVESTISVAIIDDGVGFNMLNKTQTGNGLKNIKSRTTELNGTLQIQSAPGEGTKIFAIIPLTAVNNMGW